MQRDKLYLFPLTNTAKYKGIVYQIIQSFIYIISFRLTSGVPPCYLAKIKPFDRFVRLHFSS